MKVVSKKSEDLPEIDRGEYDERAPGPSTVVEKQARTTQSFTSEHQWRNVAIHCLALLALLNGALALYAFYNLHSVKEQVAYSLWRSEQRFQSLDAQINFDSQRRHLLLGIRDEILRVNPELDLAEAFHYASLAVSVAEKYVGVDPLLLVAVGIVESHYDPNATSSAGARGLYQIYPSTGRLLARSLGWEYSEELLHDPAKNTEMAGLYLETLFAAYKDPSLVLAEYNGGPLNAGYLRANVRALASETKNYVPRVLEVYRQLVAELGVHPEMGQPGLGRLQAASDDGKNGPSMAPSTDDGNDGRLKPVELAQ